VKKLRKFNQKGFTLIELLVVVAIIGLLSSVVLISLNTARSKARDAKRLADIRQVSSALEIYFNDNGSYPVATAWTGATSLSASLTAGATKYMQALPAAPTPPDGTCATAGPSSSDANTYTYTGTAATYTIGFCLGGLTGGTSAGTHTITPNGVN
jgi:prepilin-type N-terminal cleavage/methylation domain-containing protein